MKLNPHTTLSALILALALVGGSPLSAAADATAPERAIVTKARSIILPEFKLVDVTLTQALRRLAITAKHYDPTKKGVNFMATEPALAAARPKLTLTLKNVTLKEATEQVAKAAGVSVSAQDYAFVFNPKSDKP